jgi:hypothetical protein
MSEMQKVTGAFKSNLNYYQRVAHKNFLTKLDEIYQLVRDLTIYEEKNFGQFSQ